MPYADSSEVCSASDVDLINELESRGFKVIDEDDMVVTIDVSEKIERLYLDYMLTSDVFFEKQLKLFFSEYLNKNLR